MGTLVYSCLAGIDSRRSFTQPSSGLLASAGGSIRGERSQVGVFHSQIPLEDTLCVGAIRLRWMGSARCTSSTQNNVRLDTSLYLRLSYRTRFLRPWIVLTRRIAQLPSLRFLPISLPFADCMDPHPKLTALHTEWRGYQARNRGLGQRLPESTAKLSPFPVYSWLATDFPRLSRIRSSAMFLLGPLPSLVLPQGNRMTGFRSGRFLFGILCSSHSRVSPGLIVLNGCLFRFPFSPRRFGIVGPMLRCARGGLLDSMPWWSLPHSHRKFGPLHLGSISDKGWQGPQSSSCMSPAKSGARSGLRRNRRRLASNRLGI
jgi:hypothetical protein